MSKCRIIAVANQKGGVGKTTTTFNLGVALSKEGKKVLLIDADPQADLTTYMGWHNPDNITENLATLMNKTINEQEVDLHKAILKHNEGVDLIPSNLELATLEVNLINAMSREYTLKSCLSKIKNEYDYILIDCMPSLGMITINALATADRIIIPIQSEFLATKGMAHLMSTALKVRRQINPNLEIGGILLTMVDNRTKLSKNIIKELKDTYAVRFNLFNTQIPRAIKVAESSRAGESVISYDKNNKVAKSYIDFAREVVDSERESRTKDTTTIQPR